MVYIFRKIQDQLNTHLANGRSILLLGPRQTGKTTMLSQIQADLTISFVKPDVRLQHEKDVGLLGYEIETLAKKSPKKPLIIVDEIQKIPILMDSIQYSIDNHTAQFILTGSSARKLKHGKHINLLPGRVFPMNMYPLAIDELPSEKQQLDDLLLYGALPGIIEEKNSEDKERLLSAYTTLYLEEEIRLEAVVRNIANFSHFLELAASESGNLVNFSKLSQVIGVAQSTITDYFQILEDCLIAERIEPLLQSKTRHRLSKSQKYIYFDLGVRRMAAKEGLSLLEKHKGYLFEQFIGLELIKYASRQTQRTTIKYWRDLNGPEIDWIVQAPDRLIPIEVKYTDRPTLSDARHLKLFINEYDNAEMGYIVCRSNRKIQLTDNIVAIPWQEVPEIIG